MSPVGVDLRGMHLEVGELLRNLGRKIRLETVALHDFFCGGLQVERRRIGVWHELPVRNEMGSGYHAQVDDAGFAGFSQKTCEFSRARRPRHKDLVLVHALDVGVGVDALGVRLVRFQKEAA